MPDLTQHAPDDIARCIQFAEGWYGYRDLPDAEIMKDFRFERPTISSYLTPHVRRDSVRAALDLFQYQLTERIKG